jgi:hypothetical protein
MIILIIAGYFVGCLLTLVGLWFIVLQHRLTRAPASEAEIALLKEEAMNAEDETERALAWMRVSDAEHGESCNSPIGWALLIVGLILISAMTAWVELHK